MPGECAAKNHDHLFASLAAFRFVPRRPPGTFARHTHARVTARRFLAAVELSDFSPPSRPHARVTPTRSSRRPTSAAVFATIANVRFVPEAQRPTLPETPTDSAASEMPPTSGTVQMHDDDSVAWRVSPEVTERIDRISALGIEDLLDVTSTPAPDARAAAANAPAEEENADDEAAALRTADRATAVTRDGGLSRTRSEAGSEDFEAEQEAEEKAPGGSDAPSASTPDATPRAPTGSARGAFAPNARASRDARDEAETVSPPPSDTAESVRKTRTRLVLIRARDEMFASDPSFKKRSVAELNAEAVAFLRAGDDLRCVGAFAKLFRKLLDNHLTHRDLHVCHSNRSAAYLNLGLYEEALWDARQCQRLAEARFNRDRDALAVAPIFRKAHARKGFALLGLEMPRQAKSAFEAGLAMQPDCAECKRGLEEALARIARDILEGRGLETLALPAAAPVAGKIANLPHAAPMHRVHPRDALPISLLTPFQADNEYHIKDTYNYMTVQADVRMPRKHFRYLRDDDRLDAFARAVRSAVTRIRAERHCDARVLHIGCGAGYLTMEALRAGAHHVVACDRWLYLAMACKESLLANGYGDDQVKVVYKRPTDLRVLRDVPVACNVCVNEMFDDGLLSRGLLPSFRHAAEKSLLLPDAILIPNAATVYVMPVEWRVQTVCGLDVSAVNAYRHAPSHTSGTPFAPGAIRALAPPRPAWHFDFQNPPDASEHKTVDFAFASDGKWNAVVFWYELRLCEGVVLSTAPEEVRGAAETSGASPSPGEMFFFPSSLQAAAQYLLGEICVREGDVVPLTCAHNTVQMQFTVEEAEYAHLHKKLASFPQYHFEVLRDEARARAYEDAIRRRVRKVAKQKRRSDATRGGVSVLDIGAGSGLLAMMAARAGATKVVACEWHGALATCARRNVAANGLSNTVTVASGDVAKLRRGKQGVPVDGFDVAVVDLFDAGLTGDHVLWMLEQARKHVLAPDAVVVPAAATMYCVGLEAYTAEVNGFDFSAFNKYRWDSTYRATRLADEADVRVLTKPKRVFEFFLQEREREGRGARAPSARETVARLETVASGYLNAVAFWFDLHMDEKETITTAPRGYGKGGTVLFEEAFLRSGNDPDSLRAAREAADIAAKQAMEAAAARHAATLAANPRTHLGAEAFLASENEAFETSDADACSGRSFDALGSATPTDLERELRNGGVAEADDASAVVPACAPPDVSEDTRASREGGSLGSGQKRNRFGSDAERREHYWGQAVQYLERGVQVRANKKITLLARREADRVRFSLKEGVGAFVGKPPWKIEWGGGASVESPHFQRVHYCELLVGDYLMRLRSRRFPPIEKEMRMILAHCGNLFLDPEVIAEITHWFACLELVHGQQDFSPGASIEAMSKTPLRLG